MKAVFVRPGRCVGCRQCTFACAVEHSRSRDPLQALLEDPPPRSRIQVRLGRKAGSSTPTKCRHCNPAPCQSACPTGAIERRAEFGLVLIDESRCTACGSCASACPFGVVVAHPAVSMDGGRQQPAVKCDGCVSRLDLGRVPACAEACKSGALSFAERNDIRPRRIGEPAIAAAGAPPAAP